ncbi:MAG: acyl-CoA dehydrogenase family protein [Chloroflexota bacterium]|nr:MAG: acyl-CoA dehydrogenase family protein [Chloroflexota bacterium]
MLDFELDEEQKMLVEAIGRYTDGQVRKVYRDADEDGNIPADVTQAGWEFGILPTAIPEAYGGFGDYSAVTGALAMEAFAYGDLAVALEIGVPGLVALPLLLAGTDEQKAEYLPAFCDEAPPKVSAALTEPSVQFDPRALKTTAERDGDHFVLDGSKRMVALANEANTFLVYAAENGETQAYIVPAGAEGLKIGERERLMGVRALATYGLELNSCRVPIKNRLGGETGIDFGCILSHSRVALGAAAVGVAKAGYDYARDYARGRVQFGEPIAHRQSIAFMLAEMAIEVDAARLMVWEVAWKLDRDEDATTETTVMKHFVDDMVLRVADRALQTLGGHGYIREYPVELWLRNARGFASFDGLAMV